MSDILLLKPDGSREYEQLASDLQRLQETLAQLYDALSKLLLASRTNRLEAEQWLVNSLAALFITDPGTKRRRFGQFLPGGSACAGDAHAPLSQALLAMLTEAEPSKLGQLLARETSAVRRFFKGEPERVAAWFGHFSMAGMREFKHGAYALARYALAHRADVWQLLEWRGKHAQAPIAVVQKTHYFCELDVQRTVKNLIRDCPEFWESDELAAATQTGALLQVDPGHWCRQLHGWLQERSTRSEALYSLICDYLEGPASWRQLCQHLLPLLPGEDLLRFASGLLGEGAYVTSSSNSSDASDAGTSGRPAHGPGAGSGGSSAAAASPAAAVPGAWLVLRGVQWPGLGELVLASAAGCNQGALLRLLREEEHEEERKRIQQLVPQLHALPAAAHWQLRQQLRARQREEERQEQQHGQQQEGRQAGSKGRQPQTQQQHTPTPAAVELHRLLLLQLFAAGLAVQQAASSAAAGSAPALQQQLAASGVQCTLVAQQALLDDGGHHKSNRKRRRKHSSSSKKKHRKKARRQARRSDSEDATSQGSESELEQEAGAPLVSNPAAAEVQWMLLPAAGGSGSGVAARPVLSSFELGDAVLRRTAAAYADWRFLGA